MDTSVKTQLSLKREIKEVQCENPKETKEESRESNVRTLRRIM
jgi:hypothetical protein